MPKEEKKDSVYIIKSSSKKNKNKKKTKENVKKEVKQELIENDIKEKNISEKEIKENIKPQKDNNKELDNNEENVIMQMPEETKKSLVNMEEIKSTMKNKNKIPKEELKKINKSVRHNIFVAFGVILYFIFLILGFINIKNDIYITDLKVFGMCSLFLGISLIEKAYNKEMGKFAVYGVEMIFIAVVTMALIYVNLIVSSKYIFILALISCIFAIYYIIKSIILYIKLRKKYFVNNMKEIIKEDEEI